MAVKTVAKSVGITKDVHTCHHTYATHLEDGMDIITLKDFWATKP
jgi:galactitol-specific phosphotransferase system IIB component